jgi:hypothetical protein
MGQNPFDGQAVLPHPAIRLGWWADRTDVVRRFHSILFHQNASSKINSYNCAFSQKFTNFHDPQVELGAFRRCEI